jgi:hypothetical protein
MSVVVVMPPSRTLDAPPRYVTVDASKALEVASAAGTFLQHKLAQRQEEIVEEERQRRRRFSTSWWGKALFFLREDPDADIALDSLLTDGAEGAVNEYAFELSMYRHLRDKAQRLQQQVQECEGPVQIEQDSWGILSSWAISGT